MNIKYEILQLSNPSETWYSLGIFVNDILVYSSDYYDVASALLMAKMWSARVREVGYTTSYEIKKEI